MLASPPLELVRGPDFPKLNPIKLVQNFSAGLVSRVVECRVNALRIRSKPLSLLLPMSPRHNHSLQRVHTLSRFHSCLRSCMHPYLHPASRPPYLDVPPHRYTCSVPPELHASTSRHLHRTSRPPYLHTSTLPRRTPAACFQTSRAACLTALRLQRVHITTYNAPPELHTSMLPRSARLRRASSTPYLYTSTSAHL